MSNKRLVFVGCVAFALTAVFAYALLHETMRSYVRNLIDPWRANGWDMMLGDDGEFVEADGEPTPYGTPVRVPVLMYHRVRYPTASDTYRERLMTVTPASFERQMENLAQAGFTPITPDELLYALVTSTARLPEKPVLLTFDDGYKDHYQNVLPVLQRLHFQATFFIVPDVQRYGGFMSEQMIKAAATSGVVTIGSHTLRHAYLTRLSEQGRKEELVGSKSLIENWIGKPVTSFAYPYGFLTPSVAKEVEAAGYSIAFRTGAGADHTSSTRFMLRRIQINNDTDVVRTAERYLR